MITHNGQSLLGVIMDYNIPNEISVLHRTNTGIKFKMQVANCVITGICKCVSHEYFIDTSTKHSIRCLAMNLAESIDSDTVTKLRATRRITNQLMYDVITFTVDYLTEYEAQRKMFYESRLYKLIVRPCIILGVIHSAIGVYTFGLGFIAIAVGIIHAGYVLYHSIIVGIEQIYDIFIIIGFIVGVMSYIGMVLLIMFNVSPDGYHRHYYLRRGVWS